MADAFIGKLEHGATLSDDDRATLRRATAEPRLIPARRDLIREGDAATHVHVVLSGFACRYKSVPGGGRQIVAVLVPGDMCDLHVHILGRMDHSIGTLTACRIARLDPAAVDALTARPAIARAMWWSTLTDEAILREWLMSIGQRPGEQRVGHLLCELLMRLKAVGLAADNSFALPLTQEELGDATGLTSVHINRMLRQLRERGLIALRGRQLTLPDLDGLVAFTRFNPTYLHHRREGGDPRPAPSETEFDRAPLAAA